MFPTTAARGASRLPLTPKRGNKDFYKGTGQSYVPGGGHRTGPPGKHVIGGKAKFRLMDEKVRYYVGPGADILNTTELGAYVSTKDERGTKTSRPRYNSANPHIGFAPNIYHQPLSLPRRSASTSYSELSSSIIPLSTSTDLGVTDTDISNTSALKRIRPHDTKAYSKWYQALPHEERNRIVQEARKKWYLSQVHLGIAVSQEAETASAEEAETRRVEKRVVGESA